MLCIVSEEGLLIPEKGEEEKTEKEMAVNSVIVLKTHWSERTRAKKKNKNGEIGMSSLALLKVRVAYLQCGQSSP